MGSGNVENQSDSLLPVYGPICISFIARLLGPLSWPAANQMTTTDEKLSARWPFTNIGLIIEQSTSLNIAHSSTANNDPFETLGRKLSCKAHT